MPDSATRPGQPPGPRVQPLIAEVADVIRTMRTTFGSRLDHMRYSLLRRTVARFAPGAVQFDEADPILGAGFRLGAGVDPGSQG